MSRAFLTFDAQLANRAGIVAEQAPSLPPASGHRSAIAYAA
jgi:hypothetical protein